MVNVNASNYGQIIEAICAHLNDGMFLTHKENKELYFIFRLKSFYLHEDITFVKSQNV